jgi:hypothetical protein
LSTHLSQSGNLLVFSRFPLSQSLCQAGVAFTCFAFARVVRDSAQFRYISK